MHIFNLAAAILLWSSFTAAGPLRRDKSHKFSYRQVAPFQNTTSSVEPLSSVIQVIPVSLASTESTTAELTSSAISLSTVSTTSNPSLSSSTLSSSPIEPETATFISVSASSSPLPPSSVESGSTSIYVSASSPALSSSSLESKTSISISESASSSTLPPSSIESETSTSTPSASAAGANRITLAFTAPTASINGTIAGPDGGNESSTLTATSAISTAISPNPLNIHSTSTVSLSIPASRNSTAQSSAVLPTSAKNTGLATSTFVTANSSSPTRFLSYLPPLSDESYTSPAAEPTARSRLFSFMNLTTEAPTANPTIDASPAISELSPVTLVSPALTAGPAHATPDASGLETTITSVPKFTFTSSLPTSSPASSVPKFTFTTSLPASSPASPSVPFPSPFLSASESAAPGAFSPTSEPIIEVPTVITALPTPSTIAPATYAQNLAQAENYNSVFLSLSASSPCAAGAIACISGARATCEGGKYDLIACADEQQACFALPMNSTEGVYVGCANVEEAERVLGLPNSLSVTIGTVPVVVATKTSSSEAVASATSVPMVQGQAGTPGNGEGEGEGDEESTTTLRSTAFSTVVVYVSSATTELPPARTLVPNSTTAEERGAVTVVPAAVAVGEGEGGSVKEVTVTVTESVTIREVSTVSFTTTVTTTETIGK